MGAVETASRVCQGCGRELAPRRPNHHYHGPACRQQARRDRTRTQRVLAHERYEHEVWNARRSGLIDAEEALELLVFPNLDVLDRLEVVAA